MGHATKLYEYLDQLEAALTNRPAAAARVAAAVSNDLLLVIPELNPFLGHVRVATRTSSGRPAANPQSRWTGGCPSHKRAIRLMYNCQKRDDDCKAFGHATAGVVAAAMWLIQSDRRSHR